MQNVWLTFECLFWMTCWSLVNISSFLPPLLAGVVSVSFEEDEEGNLCLIAYPLHSESVDLENKDPSADCQEPKSKMLKWSNKKQSPLLQEKENYSKDRARNSRKEDKIMRWRCSLEWEWFLYILYAAQELKLFCVFFFSLCSYNRDEVQQPEVLYFSLEKGNVVSQIKHNPWSQKCHQQQLQRMKENAKHRNQYSILFYE